MRVLFAGTPEIALPSLQALVQEHECAAVLTAPDRPAGRGRQPQVSPVGTYAIEHGIPLLRYEKLDAVARAEIAEFQCELLVCFAYGKIFGPKFLGLFPRGAVNVHPSLLPRFRGPSPISAAILAGDAVTGVSVQAMSLQMDAGAIYARREIPLDGSETTASLSEVAARIGADLLLETVAAIEQGRAAPQAQDEQGVSYCTMLNKQDALIDWARPAAEIERAVRAYQPWPIAYTYYGDKVLKIHEAVCVTDERSGGAERVAHAPQASVVTDPGRVLAVDNTHGILVQTGSGILSLRRLQLPGRKALDWNAFLNGTPNFIGSHLGGTPT